MAVDRSTIPVTIGLDVLDVLIEMAQPTKNYHRVFLQLAINARSEAQLTDTISDPLQHLEPRS